MKIDVKPMAIVKGFLWAFLAGLLAWNAYTKEVQNQLLKDQNIYLQQIIQVITGQVQKPQFKPYKPDSNV